MRGARIRCGSGAGRAGLGRAYLMAKYMGRMAKRGKVCTLIMIVMKAMYSRTLMKPGGKEKCREQQSQGLGGRAGDAGPGPGGPGSSHL